MKTKMSIDKLLHEAKLINKTQLLNQAIIDTQFRFSYDFIIQHEKQYTRAVTYIYRMYLNGYYKGIE